MRISKYFIIALMSTTLISLEIIWTRIFSAEFFYTFAFLILSLAVLGLGLGALLVRLIPALNRENGLALFLTLSGICALAGPPVIFKLGLKFSELFSNNLMIVKLAAAIMILSSAFIFGGIALALLFKNYNREMPKLYMADLIGAGLGVLGSIITMNLLGTPAATFLCSVPILIAAMITARKAIAALPVILMAVSIFLSISAEDMLEAEQQEIAPVIYKHWDAMSKIKLYEFGPYNRGINIDNVANSPVYRFDGNWDRPDDQRFQFGIAVDYLIKQFDSCVFLSLGAGGGCDVLQALQEGATEIYAVEVNGHINKMMTEGDPDGYLPLPPVDSSQIDSTGATPTIGDTSIITLAEYTGHIYADPRGRVVTEDARAFIRRYENKFDVIYSLSSNSWAALASGAFALAENYLFTTEAFMDYWRALSDSGFLMMEHQFYMPRITAEVIDALDRLEVENPQNHFAVYNLPTLRRKIMLLSKRPLDDSLRYHAIFDLTPEAHQYIHLLYPKPDSAEENIYNRIIHEGWQAVAKDVPVDISPCNDDRPFIAQMGLWKNFTFDTEKLLPYEFMGFPLAKAIIVVIILVVLLLFVPLNLIPYFLKGEKLKPIPWLYFFLIGMAFMMVEVILIQQYTLFIGPSVFGIAVILLTLLMASGIGSRFSTGISATTAFLTIVSWLILNALLFEPMTYMLGGWEMWPRMIISAVAIFPLGFFMGMPFPKGTLKVGPLIDWGFAVNGVASVLGSALIVLVAFSAGYKIALLLAAITYFLAYMMISIRKAW